MMTFTSEELALARAKMNEHLDRAIARRKAKGTTYAQEVRAMKSAHRRATFRNEVNY